MIYRYLGHDRFSLLFENPNHFAAAVAGLLLGGYAAFLAATPRAKLVHLVFWPFASVCIFAIVSSYSRGAWVACTCVFLLLCNRHRDRGLVHAALTLLVVVALGAVPVAAQRSMGIGNLHDPSIGNRLITWWASADMLVFSHGTTLSRADYIYVFPLIYQPLWIQAQNGDALNTFLSVGLYYGLGTLLLILALTVLSLFLCLRKDTRWSFVPAATTLCLGIAGVFTDLFSSVMLTCLYVLAGIATIIAGWTEIRNAITLAKAGLASLLICVTIAALVTGVLSATRQSPAVRFNKFALLNYDLFEFRARQLTDSSNTILIVVENLSDVKTVDRKIARAIVNNGRLLIMVPRSPRTLSEALVQCLEGRAATVVLGGNYANHILRHLAHRPDLLPGKSIRWVLYDVDPLSNPTLSDSRSTTVRIVPTDKPATPHSADQGASHELVAPQYFPRCGVNEALLTAVAMETSRPRERRTVSRNFNSLL